MTSIFSPKITNSSSSRYYTGSELKPYIGRPGSQHAQTLPSRTGNRLRYLDGRVTNMAGKPLKDGKS